MTMPLTDGQVPIADIDGPYGAARYDENAVAIRIWPDSLDDGLAEFTIIVTNNTWNTVTVSADNIQLVGHDSDTSVLGKSRMLARLDSGFSAPGAMATSGSDSAIDERTARTTTIPGDTAGTGQARAGSSADTGVTTIAAAVRGTGRRPALKAGADQADGETRSAIEAWYLDSLEIYPGDTGAGGFSVPVPTGNTDFELQIVIGTVTYRYPVEYRLNP